MAYFDYSPSFPTFETYGSEKKQERAVVHLEKDGQHHYYGKPKALCDHWDKDALGVVYAYLRNYGISEEKPFRNAKCVIRRGIIVTSARKKEG